MGYRQKAKAGDESGTWKIKSFSVSDAKLTVTIGVESPGGAGGEEKTKIENPKLTNLETGESILFKGSIPEGKELVIKDGNGILNKIDVTNKLLIQKSSDDVMLPREDSTWEYAETLKSSIGRFDFSKFDESVFEVGVPTADIEFAWTANLQSTFEVVLPKSILEEKGVSKEYVQNVVCRIKAGGVNGIVKLS